MAAGQPKPFLFIHVRKTAGVSLRGLLANLFPADQVLFQAHSVSGPPSPGNAIFATGHVGFDYAERFAAQPTVFTMVREPIARCLSAYHFFRNNDESFFRVLKNEITETEYQSRRRFTERARRMDMLRFLVEEEALARVWLANYQTRQLAGGAQANLADDDPRLLEIVLAYLLKSDLVGVFERLDDTLRLLAPMMGWGRLGPLQHLNSTSQPHNVDPKCIEIIRAWNALDSQLYREASRLFESKLAALSHKSANEPAPDTVCLADAREFTPDMPLRGYGWHEREFHDGKWLCWNSAAAATLDLAITKSKPRRFRCLLSHVISRDAIDKLQISVNSARLALQMRKAANGYLLQGAVPDNAMSENPSVARITFDCPVMRRPCDINPNSNDSRSLSVAIDSIWID